MSKLLSNFWFLFSIIGPGIITSTVDNDAGGIATYSVAGAQFGYSLIWTLIPITLLLIVIQEMVARMAVVTGKGLADLIREEFGVKLTVIILIGLFVANISTTIAEFAGMAAAGELLGISRYFIVPLCALLIWLFVVRSNYRTVEKIFLVLILFYSLYFISGFLAKPNWAEVGRQTLMPAIKFTSAYWFVLVAVVGTSVTPWMQFYLQSSIVEKGLKIEHLKITRWDIIAGSIITSIIAFFIILAAAATISGKEINSAEQVALALVPVAGNFAGIVFATGFFIAAFLGAWIVPLSTAYFITEGIGFESGINRNIHEAPEFYTLLGASLFIGAGIILIPGIPLIPIILLAQIINAFLLPVVLLLVLILINNKRIMKEHTNGLILNIISIIIMVSLVAMGSILAFTTLSG
ncbi:MAG TPA: Nramp family divalent metal transporter [Candidatus Nanoarchaeia archaeon]|nr:Nramp family divalent metal transporter [Candidatus Nanoarchaeia archaeon]